MVLLRCRCVFVLTLGLLWCTGLAIAQGQASFDVVDLDTHAAFDKVSTELATKRVVFIGETHDRYDHHLNQLEIIRRLHGLDANFAIGVEYFPRTFQPQLDDYVAGRTTEAQFLRASEYYKNWGYDYRLYAPIFRFARDQHISLRALNVPRGLASAVAKVGIAGLTEQQRATLPQIEQADDAYRKRIRPAFELHKDSSPGAFERFIEAQLVWDEGMAENAASYLNENPARRLVVLAGTGHVEFGAGIPKRLERRTKASFAIILSSGEDIEPRIADYLLLSKRQDLPPAGTLGASLEEKDGECRIVSLTPGGAADKSGLKKGDVLVSVDQQSIRSITDVRLAIWDKKPADSVMVQVREKHAFGRVEEREVMIELTAPVATGEGRLR